MDSGDIASVNVPMFQHGEIMPTYEEIISAGVGIEAEAWGYLGAGEGDYVEINPYASFPVPVGGFGGIGGGISFNSGCGVLEYSRDNTVTPPLSYEGGPFDIILDAFFPAFMYGENTGGWWPPYLDWNDWRWPAKMDKSYILEVAAALTAHGERTCYRMEMDITYRGYGWDWPGGEELSSSTYGMISTRYTPLGAMTPTIYDKIGCAVGGEQLSYPARDLKDLDWFYPPLNSCAKYSDVVMVQCYTAQIAQRYRTLANSEAEEWVWDGDQAFFTAAQISIDYNADDITAINPKNQTRIAALEAKLVEAMDEAAALAGDGKCIDYMNVTIRE